jgi:hypothetical protein
VAVQIGKLERLVIHEDKDALFGREQRVETSMGDFSGCHGLVPNGRTEQGFQSEAKHAARFSSFPRLLLI